MLYDRRTLVKRGAYIVIDKCPVLAHDKCLFRLWPTPTPSHMGAAVVDSGESR